MDAGVSLIPIVAIIGGLGIAAMAIWRHIRHRELLHRERLAMIEKGMAPPAASAEATWEHWDQYRGARCLRRGVLFICIGIGVALLVGVGQGQGTRGYMIGAFIMMFGVANLINAMIGRRAAGPGPESLPPGEPRPPMTN